MEIAGRAQAPWDALLVFHVLSSQGDDIVADRLRALVARDEAKPGVQVVSGKPGSPCRIIGRYLPADDCPGLLSAWNQPDGDAAWMCYVPNHGIATVTDGQLDWWALICFQCANAGLAGPRALPSGSVPNRTLPTGSALKDRLTDLLPDRPFPVRS
ncbi:MAG: hypothetical protein AAFY65_01940 [Pseudomonadota bacterium]